MNERIFSLVFKYSLKNNFRSIQCHANFHLEIMIMIMETAQAQKFVFPGKMANATLNVLHSVIRIKFPANPVPKAMDAQNSQFVKINLKMMKNLVLNVTKLSARVGDQKNHKCQKISQTSLKSHHISRNHTWWYGGSPPSPQKFM
jgi:hypothetical protein